VRQMLRRRKSFRMTPHDRTALIWMVGAMSV
jgi:hypothetical protein